MNLAQLAAPVLGEATRGLSASCGSETTVLGGGGGTCLRMCLDIIHIARKERPVHGVDTE